MLLYNVSVTDKRSKALDNKVRLKRDIILVLSMVIIAAAAFLIINYTVKKMAVMRLSRLMEK